MVCMHFKNAVVSQLFISVWCVCASSLQVEFWAQHVSFFLVGIIVVTSIRGLLITFTKVPPPTQSLSSSQDAPSDFVLFL